MRTVRKQPSTGQGERFRSKKAFKTVRNTFLLFMSRSLWKSVRVALSWGFSGRASGKEPAYQRR